MWGTLGGVLVMSLVNVARAGAAERAAAPLWKEAITGALIITAALIDRQRRRIPDQRPRRSTACLSCQSSR
ncbi:MAG: hypothetical protein U0521_12470 [Anaerolineae bacterium]